jgi:hypothetical protein
METQREYRASASELTTQRNIVLKENAGRSAVPGQEVTLQAALKLQGRQATSESARVMSLSETVLTLAQSLFRVSARQYNLQN